MAISVVLTVLQTVALGVVARRLLPGARRELALVAPLLPATERVSVVIPARNEELRLDACLSNLHAGNDAIDEVVIVDDESTDQTAEVAHAQGATVLYGDPLPPGWVGKPWALHQGLRVVRNDVVVFLDADVIPQSGLIDALVEQLRDHDIVTLSPCFRTATVAEQALHASMLAGLVYRFGAVGTNIDAHPERIYGNGQCMVFRRSWLLNEGGIELIANQMNDDIALLRALASRGARVGFRDGRNLLHVRMHESASDVWAQWGRSLPMVETSTAAHRWFDIATLLLTLVLPVLRIFTKRRTITDIGCLLMRLGMSHALAPSYYGKKVGVYLSPLLDGISTLRLTQATCVPVRAWRGRRYTPQGSEDRRTS